MCLKNNRVLSFFSSKAFSLIEILVVLLILAFIFSFIAQRISRKDEKIRTVFEKLIRLNRRLVNLSQLHNQTYRWVIQINSEGPESYWVEKKQIQNQISEQSAEQKEDGETTKSRFYLDDSFYPEPKNIHPLLNITKVDSSLWEGSKTEGLVYIYYYPKGLAQETSIQFFRTDNQAEWTLYLDPITKNLRIIGKTESQTLKNSIEKTNKMIFLVKNKSL